MENLSIRDQEAELQNSIESVKELKRDQALVFVLRYLMIPDLLALSACSKTIDKVVYYQTYEIHMNSTSIDPCINLSCFAKLAFDKRFLNVKSFTVQQACTICDLDSESAKLAHSYFWRRLHYVRLRNFCIVSDSLPRTPQFLPLTHIQRLELIRPHDCYMNIINSCNPSTLTHLLLEAPVGFAPARGAESALAATIGRLHALHSLTLTQLFPLHDLHIPALQCSTLRVLHVTRCPLLVGLACPAPLAQLHSLDVSWTQIQPDSMVTLLSLCRNTLRTLVARHCYGLTRPFVLSAPWLQQVDLEFAKCLPMVDVASPALTSLSLKGCAALQEIKVNAPQLTSLNLALLPVLSSLNLSCSLLCDLDVSGCRSLGLGWPCTGQSPDTVLDCLRSGCPMLQITQESHFSTIDTPLHGHGIIDRDCWKLLQASDFRNLSASAVGGRAPLVRGGSSEVAIRDYDTHTQGQATTTATARRLFRRSRSSTLA